LMMGRASSATGWAVSLGSLRMAVSTLKNNMGFTWSFPLAAEIGVGDGDFFHTLYLRSSHDNRFNENFSWNRTKTIQWARKYTHLSSWRRTSINCEGRQPVTPWSDHESIHYLE
jgi:hypothetical protein